MMQKRILITLLLIMNVWSATAQLADTLKFMTYNLLNYRNTTNQCTNVTNNSSDKEAALRTLFLYYKPDVLVCQEISANPQNSYAFIQDNVMNVNGETAYRSAAFTNNNFSSLVNMLYYNSDKVGLLRQEAVTRDGSNQFLVRVIDIYHMYYKDPNLSATSDTVFFTVVAAHLKAGNSSSDAADRSAAAAALMNYLSNNMIRGNVLLMGDLNVYTDQEGAMQNLTNFSDQSVRFYDPIDQLGNWSSNNTYRFYHTQSTRSSNTNGGCFSGGGMDDRFDFILTQFPVLAPTNDFRYIDDSYRALGQDGRDYNQELDVNNNSLPTVIAQSIYDISDHLPVKMEVEVDKLLGVGVPSLQTLLVVHPTVASRSLPIRHEGLSTGQFVLYNLAGQRVASQSAIGTFTTLPLPVAAGLYLITYEVNGIPAWRSKVMIQ